MCPCNSQVAATMHYGKLKKHSWLKQPSHKLHIHYIRSFFKKKIVSSIKASVMEPQEFQIILCSNFVNSFINKQ